MISRRQYTSNLVLAAFIVVQATKIFTFYLSTSLVPLPTLISVLHNLSFTSGPLMYFYVSSLVSTSFTWRWRQFWHLVPFLAMALFSVAYYPHTSSLHGLDWMEAYPQYRIVRHIHAAISSAWFVGYLFLALRLLPRYELLIRNQYSSIEAITLDWLHRVLVFTTACYLLLLAVDMLTIARPNLGVMPRTLFQFLGDISVFYMVGLAGIRHGLLVTANDATTSEVPTTSTEPRAQEPSNEYSMNEVIPKYGASSLSEELNTEILALADNYMASNKPYLKSTMQLSDLAAGIDVSTHELSQAINTSGSTFYDYVNRYRAHKAKDLLESDRHHHLAIHDIAVEAGFASKSTFYKYFRSHYQLTPAQYRKTYSQTAGKG